MLHRVESAQTVKPVTAPRRTLAAVLSLLIPGAGQMYRGKVGSGFLWLAAVFVLWFALWPLAVVVHLYCIYDAARSS